MAPQRPTQKTIAEATGLTQATVSMALAGHPKISAETRQLVLDTAERLGYRPDPVLSALSAYRKQVVPAGYQATLAWLANEGEDPRWKQSSTFRLYHSGALKRAQELGYNLEEHYLLSEGMTPRRLAELLQARNIPGMLIAPQPAPDMHIDFDFTHFSAVTFGYTLSRPALHLATLHQFRSMKKLLANLIGRGYKRLGLALGEDSDRRADYNWSGAYMSFQRHLPSCDHVPVHMPETLEQPAFTRWFKQHRPDVVISINRHVHAWLTEAGERIPETTGVALLSVPDGGEFYSGIWENPELIGARALEFLVDLIHRRECGVPTIPLSQLVDGTWVEGTTLRSPQ
ncbi:LacI family DNA-binding transcriptional regulator [Ruficoccus sp. ZRK36]|uniref:LacI family DNA-binding transcriptional regulator n=1 Tax=Ruficoccus sp. ZRK36 TaxID=2866311 RepID=UPI001C72F16F|nr:LacI family DNA-binding transcriptional regulator [Ruficoccus sp. ZRK36]QYY35219.1 LacI family transcriptional regulator [Ruficoccus sp. ZRK36]